MAVRHTKGRADTILKKKIFDSLQKKVKALLKSNELDICKENRSLISQKMPELNRPPIKTLIQKAIQALNVDWRDLYPEIPADQDWPGQAINMRNSLMHTGRHAKSDDDIDLFGIELVRTRQLVERMLANHIAGRQIDINQETLDPNFQILAKKLKWAKDEGATKRD